MNDGAFAHLALLLIYVNSTNAAFTMNDLTLRAANEADFDSVWLILEPVIRSGDTYALPRDLSREETLAYWFADNHRVFVAEINQQVVGTYFLQANQRGGGSHVANCGYVTRVDFSGRGVARKMCEHSMAQAKTQGFLAMQFNFVVSSNEHAVTLWNTLGFKIVGTLPNAFVHPKLGFVDVFVMYREI